VRAFVVSISTTGIVVLSLACMLLLSPAAQSQTFKVLYTFTGGNDGGNPYAAPVLDAKGNLYGTAFGGGNAGCAEDVGCGTVFELTPGPEGWSESTLHSFTGGADGANPFDSLILDAAGNLYGTAEDGGDPCETYGCGVAFELSPGSGGWNETVLYDFPGAMDGYYPIAAATFDKRGNLYSTLSNGGFEGEGIVYELAKSGGSWNEEVLASVASEPTAPVVFDTTGNLYTTTSLGGASNCGTVVELLHGSWKPKVLYEFPPSGGCRIWGGLALDKSANLYGTTEIGGAYGMGTVFKLMHSKGGKWTETVLHSFKGGSDGYYPQYCTPVLDMAGNLYGTTEDGGDMSTCNGNGCGTVFKLTPGKGGRWKKTILHRFAGGSDGIGPEAGVVLDSAGNIYGTTEEGGNTACGGYGCGVVFEITP
jgi:uncharacterized repeat protein (TIGR03803 family)